MPGFVTVFLDGPARGQYRTWPVGNPPMEITVRPFRSEARGEHWEMVRYSGLLSEPAGPAGVELHRHVHVRVVEHVHRDRVVTHRLLLPDNGLVVDLWQPVPIRAVQLDARQPVRHLLRPRQRPADLSGGRVVRVVTDDENVEPVSLDNIGAVQQAGAGINDAATRRAAARIAAEQTWPAWERGL